MSSIEINPLDAKYIEEITEIFTSSFENYPLMEFFFGDKYKQSMTFLTKLICDEKSTGENLLLGAFLTSPSFEKTGILSSCHDLVI